MFTGITLTVLSGVRAPALPPSTLGGRITRLGDRTSLLLLLLTTLGRCASLFITLGRVAVLVVACVVGCNNFDSTPIALLILLSMKEQDNDDRMRITEK